MWGADVVAPTGSVTLETDRLSAFNRDLLLHSKPINDAETFVVKPRLFRFAAIFLVSPCSTVSLSIFDIRDRGTALEAALTVV